MEGNHTTATIDKLKQQACNRKPDMIHQVADNDVPKPEKNAVSYSSPSSTEKSESVKRHVTPRLQSMQLEPSS